MTGIVEFLNAVCNKMQDLMTNQPTLTCSKQRAIFQFRHYASGINFSKCFRAAAILSCVKDVVGVVLAPVALAMIIMMYVLPVNMSMYAVKCELRTSMAWNCDWDLEQLILNCLMILDIRSNRWLS